MIKKYLITESAALSYLLFFTGLLSLFKFIAHTDDTVKAIYLLIFVSGLGFGGLLSVHKLDKVLPKKRRK